MTAAAGSAAPAVRRVPSRRARRSWSRSRTARCGCWSISLTWGLLNFVWLALLRRPALAAGLSFAMFAAVIWVSRFKHQRALDDRELHGRDDHRRRDRRLPLDGVAGGSHHRARRRRGRDPDRWCCSGGSIPGASGGGSRRRLRRHASPRIVGVSFAFPLARRRGLRRRQQCFDLHALGRARRCRSSRPRAIWNPTPAVTERLKLTGEEACHPAGKRPHIILLHDESSFDIRAVNDIKVPPGYGDALQVVRRQGSAPSWSRAPAGRAGTPSTTCSRGFRRVRSGASSSS